MKQKKALFVCVSQYATNPLLYGSIVFRGLTDRATLTLKVYQPTCLPVYENEKPERFKWVPPWFQNVSKLMSEDEVAQMQLEALRQ